MIQERRLQPPVSVVLSTMQNKDQCDKRRAHTSKPIFCTLLSHIKKPFNPLYLTMPAGLNPRELIHSDSVSEIFLKPSMATWFSHLPSFYTNSVSCPSPVDHLCTQSHEHIPLERDVQKTYEGDTHPKHRGVQVSFSVTCTGTLKHIPCWVSALLRLSAQENPPPRLPFRVRQYVHGKHRLRGNPASKGYPCSNPAVCRMELLQEMPLPW